MQQQKGSFEKLVGTLIDIMGLVGVVATVLGVVIAIRDPQSFIDLFSEPAPTATYVSQLVLTPTLYPSQTPYPTYTPYPDQVPLPTYTPFPTQPPCPTSVSCPTSTAYPTYTPDPTLAPVSVVVTATPEPSPTAPENTPPGSVLARGESWKQNGVVLTLDEVFFNVSYSCFTVHFTMLNETQNEIFVSAEERHFECTDNLGREWGFYYASGGTETCSFSDYFWWESMRASIPPGGIWDSIGTGTGFTIGFEGDLTDPKVEYIDVVVDGLSQITGATWRIELAH